MNMSVPELSNYEINALIHESDRTLVYRGQRANDGQPVVIKLMRREYPTFNELVQFRNQYAIAKNLDVELIVKPYALERYQNRYALIMEDFGGISLGKYYQNSSPSIPEFLSLGIQLSQILHQLHQNRVIHKDIKPAHILIHPETQEAKLIDFSIASQLPKEQQELVSPNILEGTLAYISPEQTGRMNRSIDYRTDYYSLGVTFYQLLTGQLPFESRDAMELVHCHIALDPRTVREVNPQVPRFVSDIVAKLMAKNAENRYQSASGIQHDLELAAQHLQRADTAAVLELGLRDITEHFLIPEKLYGRGEEVALLLETFGRVAGTTSNSGSLSPSSEFLLVAGFSGVGKTSAINEIHKPIVQQRGYFIAGKFDQFQQNVPYSAIVAAFRKLVQQLLSEPEDRFQQWSKKLQAALGENAQVIVEVIPEVESLIGPQPPVPQLGPTETQLRFNQVFRGFMRVFCAPEHPLAIFLDDLQWADAGTLNLIELMMSDRTLTHLMLIGAYRDNETSPEHPLILLLEQLRRLGVKLNEIFLQPLSLSHLSELIADTLSCEKATIAPLAALVHQKTEGNPFFANECLKALHQEGLLQFNPTTRQWEWDIAQIEARGITDDVVELMVGKLRLLPIATQTLLSLAACIGATFDLGTLAIVSQRPRAQVHQDLTAALQKGFILPTAKLDPELLIESYRFGHDRIQQAAYALIPRAEREQTHLHIGRLLLQELSEEEQRDRCFEIADRLNQAILLIRDVTEQIQLARLNLQAAEKAKTALAHNAALQYASIGTDILNERIWTQDPTLARALYRARVDIEYLCGHFDNAMAWVDATLEKSTTDLEKADMYIQQLTLQVLSGNYAEGIATTYTALPYVEIAAPADADIESATQHLREKISDYLQGRDATCLMELPKMTDPVKMMAMNLLNELIPASYVAKPELFAWVVVMLVVYSIEYGLHSRSFLSFGCYGMLLVADEKYIDAYTFADVALHLAQQWQEHLQITRTAHILSAFVMAWTHSVELVEDIQQLVTSDLTFLGYNQADCFASKWLEGRTIAALLDETRAIDRTLAVFENKYTEVINSAYRFGLLALQGNPADKIDCDGKAWKEADFIEECLAQQWLAGLCTHYIMQALIYYFNEDYATAYFLTREAEKYILTRRAGTIVSLFYLHHCLILAANYADRPKEQPDILAELERHQQQIQRWREHCPENFEQLYLLVTAEIDRLKQQEMAAVAGYDKAIAAAGDRGFIHHEAMANECAARFWLEREKTEFARIHLVRAWRGYEEWGAIAKIQQLQQRYGSLLQPIFNTESLNVSAVSSHPTLSTVASSNSSLDLAAAIKASRAISGEIELDSLLRALIQIVLENAGADKGTLILNNSDNWVVAVQCDRDNCDLLNVPLDGTNNLPHGLVNTVKRTRQTILVNNIEEDETSLRDPYFTENRPQSLCCIPILERGKLLGILYLENNFTARAFTSDRLEVLNLLSAQAAVSIENARLYKRLEDYSHDLEAQVEARTGELQEKNQDLQEALKQLQHAQAQLIHTEKMSALGRMVAGVAHEINNPVNFIAGNLTYARDYVQDLLELLDLYEEKLPELDVAIEDKIEEIDLEYLREDLPKVFDSMQGGSDRIRNIVLGLRNFSRLGESERKRVDVREGLENTLLILQHRFLGSEERAEIAIVKHYGQLPPIDCYPSQLNQVFFQIIGNAIDALRESQAREELEIRIATEMPDRQTVRVRIADNGPGMSESDRQKAFDPFFTTKPVGKGTGLGLSISYQIVIEQHGGRLQCVSELGKGTEFIIDIPILNW